MIENADTKVLAIHEGRCVDFHADATRFAGAEPCLEMPPGPDCREPVYLLPVCRQQPYALGG